MTGRAESPTDGITVRLRGGLGNQLFQFAAGSAVADRLACPLFVDTGPLAAVLPGDTPRAYELDWLVDPANVLAGSTSGLAGRLLRRAARHVPIQVGAKTFTEGSFAYDANIAAVQPGTTLEGYFQSWRYFDSIEVPLRSKLQVVAPRSQWRASMEEELSASGPWTAVHVRRGDYLKPRNSAYHGLLGPSYYHAALAELAGRGLDHRVVLFSDDPDAAAGLVDPEAAQVEIVRPPADTNPIESVLLMSRATAVVTANSSFSWWAAWLADPLGSTVVCPAPWLSAAGADERDLRPPQWLTIDAGFMSA